MAYFCNLQSREIVLFFLRICEVFLKIVICRKWPISAIRDLVRDRVIVDRELWDAQFLSDGIINGFQVVPSMLSSREPVLSNKVEQTLLEEIAEGNYMLVNKKPTIVSALSKLFPNQTVMKFA